MNFKPILMTIALCASFSSPFTNSSFAATKALDKDFLSFWPGFKAALQKNDAKAIASMTKLPYLDPQGDKKLDEAAFIARANKIFPPATRKCLLKGKPIADKDSVMVFCDDDIFIFAKDHGKYKFIEIGVND